MAPIGTILNLDLLSLMRRGVSGALRTLHGFLPLVAMLAALVASAITGAVQFFGSDWIPNVQDYVADLEWINGDLAQLVMFSIDANTLVLVLDGTLRFLCSAVPFALAWLVSFTSLSWLFTSKVAIRRQFKDFLER